MKKIISFFLVITVIMSSLNFETVEALSNKINEVYNTVSKSESEEMNSMEDKESELEEVSDSEKASDSEGEKSQSEETADSEDKEIGFEGKKDSEEDKVDTEDTNDSNENEISSYANPGASVRVYDGKVSSNTKYYTRDNLKLAIDTVKTLKSSEITIKFLKNYSITSEDAEAIKFYFTNERLIFEAEKDVKVTVTEDLMFHHDRKLPVPQYMQDPASVITFQNIKLEFTANHNIFANGLRLHMGKNIEMIGSNYPNLFGGKSSSGPAIMEMGYASDIYIESGTYNEVTTASDNGGLPVTGGSSLRDSNVNLYGGYVKEISLNKSDQGEHLRGMKVSIYGGKVDKVEYERIRNNNSNIYLTVLTDISINEVVVRSLRIGEDKKLIVNSKIELENLNLDSKSTFEMGEKVPKLFVQSLSFGEGCTLRLPGGRDKDNTPFQLNQYPTTINKIRLELSTKGNEEKFYLMTAFSSTPMDRDFFIIEENEYFYLDKIETDSVTGNQYVQGKLKESGPLIYDTNKNEITYVSRNGTEEKPWWIYNKIANGNIDWENLTYDYLAKADEYYVLSPDLITIKIKGSGSNRTFKFNNERHNDRKFNIEFDNLKASDSEFSFKNINSIIVSGENSITQSTSSNKIGLTYSISGNDRDALTFTDDNSSFVVYNKDDKGDRYDIKSNIVNSGTVGNTFIANISFEDPVRKDKKMQLKSTDSSAEVMKFPLKSGYDEMSVLLKGNNKDYLLIDGDKTNIEGVYYYQSARNGNNQNSGPVGTKFTLEANSLKNYYNVNNKQRVHVVATRGSEKFYYLENTLQNAMAGKVSHVNATHEVVFLGDYQMESDDATAIKNHNGNTNGITFKTKVDDWKYTVKINDDIELKNNIDINKYITFNEIKFKYESAGKWIYGNGRNLTFGSDVEMEGLNYPSVSGGERSGTNDTVEHSKVTINSGTYEVVTGNLDNTVRNINLTINNGTFNGEVSGISGGTANNATLTINNGTFNSKVSGIKIGSTVNGPLTLKIDVGTFNGEVSGIDGGTVNNATLTINNGTFNSKVSGTKTGSTLNGALNLKIEGGTFKGVVAAINGGTVNSNSKLTITNGIFKNNVYGINSGGSLTGNFDFQIDNGTFENKVLGVASDVTRGIFKRFIFRKSMRGISNGTLNIKINNGAFSNQVQAISSGADNATVNLEISGGNFNHNVVALGKSAINGTANMNITNGTYNGQVVGQYSENGVYSAKSVELNIEGGTFNNLIYGAVLSDNTTINVSGGTFNSGSKLNAKLDRGGNSKININDNISVQEIGNFDKLVVGENQKSKLTIKNKIVDSTSVDNNPFKSELIINNGSEVKLDGTDQSQVKKLKLESSGNTLTLAMNRDTAPLIVKNGYEPGSNKLILNAVGTKVNDKKLIEFSSSNGDAINFDFKDQNYYIREIDNGLGNGSGNTIKVYEKMDPNSLAFKVDIDGNDLKYSIDNRNEENVWWYDLNLSNQNINFLEDDMFKYKGMGLFKDMNNITSGNKIFEITNSTVDNKNITIDLGAGKDFDLKLNNSNLNNSTLSAKNIKDLVLEGANSISELTGTKNPFDSNISGEVKSSNIESHLNIFTNESRLPFSGSLVNGRKDVARIMDFKFREDFINDEQLRLVPVRGGSEIVLTVPDGTGRLGVLFGKANNMTYNLYHGNGNSGTSVYVSGNTDATFRDTFDTVANNSRTTYEYVRRARPINKVSVDFTRDINFTIDAESAGVGGIDQNNWQQYFKAKDMNFKNNSLVCKDEFIDEQGNVHHFGKVNTDLEFGYLGVKPSTNSSNSIELVDKSLVDPSIPNTTAGVKLALKFNDGTNDIPLDESFGIVTSPIGKWTVSSNANESLKIVPDFNGNTFYNVSKNSPVKMSSSHNFMFRFRLLTP